MTPLAGGYRYRRGRVGVNVGIGAGRHADLVAGGGLIHGVLDGLAGHVSTAAAGGIGAGGGHADDVGAGLGVDDRWGTTPYPQGQHRQ